MNAYLVVCVISTYEAAELKRVLLNTHNTPSIQQINHRPKKKKNLPGNPDPDAEVIALSPNSLQTTNRFLCEICNKGFKRDQNLQLHRRGHNLPWKLKQRTNKEGSRSTLAESTVRRSGSVKSAQNVMRFNQTGKLTLKFVARESIDVIVALFFLGGTVSSLTELSVIL
ncbi:hypothetical protein OIU78_002137 [Salix suchowensis]|nr:hypothetical protein OIU78_002137 [Salix suchowensis]